VSRVAAGGSWLPELDLSDAALDTAFAPFKWPNDTELRAELRRALNAFQEGNAAWLTSASPGAVRDELEKVIGEDHGDEVKPSQLTRPSHLLDDGHAGKLLQFLRKISDQEEGVDGALRSLIEVNLPSHVSLIEARRAVMFLSAALAKSLRELPKGERGRPANPHRTKLLHALRGLYHRAGGTSRSVTRRTGQASGELLEIAFAALRLVGEDESKAALAKEIERLEG
jgi:hypothetical protein